MNARVAISAIAFHVGDVLYQVHLCPITGQFRVTTAGVRGYVPVDSEAHRVAKTLWDGAAGAMYPKPSRARRATKSEKATP